MAPRNTRSKAAKGTKTTEDTPGDTAASKQLQAADSAHRICVIPRETGAGSQIIYLPHPAMSDPAAFFFSPDSGRVFEVTKVTAPKKSPRSWLIARDDTTESADTEDASIAKGYIIEDADMLVATPFDPLFLLTSLFHTGKAQEKNSFRLADDYMDLLSEQSPTLARLARHDKFSWLLLKRLESVSDVQDIGDDKVYRLNQVKLAQILVQKACRMIDHVIWPSSMDEVLVKKELDIPVTQAPSAESEDQILEDRADQESATATVKDVTVSSVAPAVVDRMRLRRALDYLMASYIPQNLRTDIEALLHSDELKSTSPLLDLTILNDHLEKVKSAKAEAAALRSLSDNISRKRGMDDEEMADARAEKRRKKEEEDKKAKMESRAIKNLKKVDTSGMKKLSSFFTKAASKKEQAA